MRLTEITTEEALSPSEYDDLTCCDQPALVAHATESLPVPGAVCERCLCAVTSQPSYGPVSVNRCTQHRR